MAMLNPPGCPIDRVDIISPASDPESPKCIDLESGLARRVLQWIGVELDRPLITQVSRFDPWKDPLGVITAYRLVKREVPQVQLAPVGSMALDDPEGWAIYREFSRTADAAAGRRSAVVQLAVVGRVQATRSHRRLRRT